MFDVVRSGTTPVSTSASRSGALSTTIEGLTGVSCAPVDHPQTTVLWGSPLVSDVVSGVTLSRHARSFFQGNRFLLQPMVDDVLGRPPEIVSSLRREAKTEKGDFDGHPFRGNQYTTGFHGTSEEVVESILKNGIRPSEPKARGSTRPGEVRGQPRGVYVAPSLEDAEWWANLRISGSPEGVRLAIFEVSGLDTQELKPDPKREGSFYSVKSIPPENLKSVTMYRYESRQIAPGRYRSVVKDREKFAIVGGKLRKAKAPDVATWFIPVWLEVEEPPVEKGGPGSGDVEGHPFRGNQYVEGEGEGSGVTDNPRDPVEAFDNATTAKEIDA
mgnify:CR=1 FL=1